MLKQNVVLKMGMSMRIMRNLKVMSRAYVNVDDKKYSDFNSNKTRFKIKNGFIACL